MLVLTIIGYTGDGPCLIFVYKQKVHNKYYLRQTLLQCHHQWWTYIKYDTQFVIKSLIRNTSITHSRLYSAAQLFAVQKIFYFLLPIPEDKHHGMSVRRLNSIEVHIAFSPATDGMIFTFHRNIFDFSTMHVHNQCNLGRIPLLLSYQYVYTYKI